MTVFDLYRFRELRGPSLTERLGALVAGWHKVEDFGDGELVVVSSLDGNSRMTMPERVYECVVLEVEAARKEYEADQ